MKSQIKDIVIGIFAVIGFTAIVMGFNNPAEPQQVTYATPESHVWEMPSTFEENFAYIYNKKTGEVRKLNSYTPEAFSSGRNDNNIDYVVMKEIVLE